MTAELRFGTHFETGVTPSTQVTFNCYINTFSQDEHRVVLGNTWNAD